MALCKVPVVRTLDLSASPSYTAATDPNRMTWLTTSRQFS